MLTTPHVRRLLVASVVGLLVGLFALFALAIPTWGLLVHFAQYSPIDRLSILVKLLSPLLSLLLAWGWVWVLLWIGDTLLSARQVKQPDRPAPMSPSSTSRVAPPRRPLLPEPRIAVPPLFQLDPTDPAQVAQLNPLTFPATPLPPTDPAWLPARQDEERREDVEEKEAVEMDDDASEERREEAREKEAEEVTIEQMPGSLEGDKPEQQNQSAPTSPTDRLENFSLRLPDDAQKASPVVITLLKDIRVRLLTPDGTTREVKLRPGENAIRLNLLAYIACQLGARVDRDKILTYVIGRGRRKNMAPEKLSEVFDAAKKFLREDLKKAVSELNTEAGREVIAEKAVDFFRSEATSYRLHRSCRVVDLEELKRQHEIIERARKEGLLDEKLDGSLPEGVLEACQKLVDAYPGDFLEDFIENSPQDIGSWSRDPFTHYRDLYLEALWIMATAESALGRKSVGAHGTAEHQEEQRRQHVARAAQLFSDYALFALGSKWDRKLKFAALDRDGKDGERVVMASRAIRRAVVELGKLGKTETIDQVYLTFKRKMASLSEGQWKPDKETESDVAEAKKQTSAYRFSAQVSAVQDPHQ